VNSKILVITPVKHIEGVSELIESSGEVTYMDHPDVEDVMQVVQNYSAIFTNPNKSKIYLGPELIDKAMILRVIATASTGTNHIDMDYAKRRNIKVLSLTEERDVIEKITSTAEHAFTLTMASLRRLVHSHNDALMGEWDYTKYIGRQLNSLTIGVIGYGRLGSLYAKYCQAFGSKVMVFDPYKEVKDANILQVKNIEELMRSCDILSLHVHVNDETKGMINKTLLNMMKNDILIVNTSRGEVINELDLVDFLEKNTNAMFATDVLTDEIRNRMNSPIFRYVKNNSKQIVLTQHIGGMTKEAQEIAYGHAAKMLQGFFKNKG